MPYNPTDHSAQNIPLGAYDKPLDGKFMFYDKVYFKYRPFISNNEVLNYFIGDNRKGNFDILINTGGTLTEGVVIGGSNSVWWFKDGIADSNLNIKSSGGGDLTNYYTITQTDNLLDAKASLTGADFIGNISAPNLSGNNTGDQNLDEVLKEGNQSVESITLNIDENYDQYIDPNRNIVVYTDSNGGDANDSFVIYPAKSWVTLLGQDLNVNVINRSIAGARLQSSAIPPSPTDNSLYRRMDSMTPFISNFLTPLMIINLGTNDVVFNPFNSSKFTQCYNEIIDYAHLNLGWPLDRIYITSPMYRGEANALYATNLALMRDLVADISINKQVNFVDLYTAFKNVYSTSLFVDGTTSLHVSPDTGHLLIRDVFKKAILQNEFYKIGYDKLDVQGKGNFTRLSVKGTSEFTDTMYLTDMYQRGASRYSTFDPKYSLPTIIGLELFDSSLFTLGAGWSGDQTTGFVHTIGNIENLINSFAPIVNTWYVLDLTMSGRTLGSANISVGGYSIGGVGSNIVGRKYYFKAIATTGLIIIPTTDFDGAVIVSLKTVNYKLPIISSQNDEYTVRIGPTGLTPSLFIGSEAGKYATGNNNHSFGNNSFASLAYGSDDNVNIGGGNANDLQLGIRNIFIGPKIGGGLQLNANANVIIGGNVNGLAINMSNTIIIANGNGVQMLNVNTSTDRGQRKFLATPTGATGPFGSRVIDNLDLPVVDVTHGGNGISVYAIGDLTYAATTTTLARRAAVATGSVLLSQGVGVAPIWGKVTSAQVDTTIAITASPTFTGTPLSTTATPGTNTTQIATTAFATAADNLKANIASPIFTGVVTSPAYSLSALNTAPASSTSTGTTGEIRVTSGFIYVCTATNTWVRTALTTW